MGYLVALVMFGFLNIRKPSGPSSYDMIRRVRRCVGRKVKVGHAGTLDPLAEGVLVVCLGQATRLVDMVQAYPKRYITLARLGATSTTDDNEGQITETPVTSHPSAENIRQVVQGFVGVIEQVPPAYSAVKVGGKRAYKIAREGKTPDLAPKKVTVHSLEIVEYEYPHLRLAISCGSGTYVRSLVRDIGAELGLGGYCEKIIREAVGPFKDERSVKIDDIKADNIEQFLIPPVEIIPPEFRITVTDEQVRELAHGRTIDWPGRSGSSEKLLGAVDTGKNLIGLLRPDPAGGKLRPEKIFIQT